MTELDNVVKAQQEAIIRIRKQLELMQKKIDELEKKLLEWVMGLSDIPAKFYAVGVVLLGLFVFFTVYSALFGN